MDFQTRLNQLKEQGIGGCSQVMAKLGLELTSQESPDLIRAMSGLTGGMGGSGSACGVLTGGAAVLGYYAGRGQNNEIPHPQYKEMIRDYVDWFVRAYGSDRCYDIIQGDKDYGSRVCPGIMEAGFSKVKELLEIYGILDQ